jgi:nucleoside-diphosphate-sugar epimerase
MKVLITGSNGKVGSELLNLFLNKTNHDLIIINRKKKIINKNKRMLLFKHNLLKKFNHKIDVDVIIHCATKTDLTVVGKNLKKKLFDTNVNITKNIQRFANNNKVKKIFFLSTTMVKNDSKKKIISERDISRKDFYARSKLLSEKILCDKKNYFKTICIRLPGVLSKKIPKISSQSFLKGEVLMKFITLMMINKDIQIFNPNKKFNNVTDVKEVFRFINKNLKKQNKNYVVQFSATKPIEFIKVIKILKNTLKSSSKIKISNKKINSFYINNSKLIKTFDFLPSSTEKILKRFCREISILKN